MTTINITDEYIKVEGHSGYDVLGKDIVCAAISVLVESTYNYLLATRNTVKVDEEEAKYTIWLDKLNSSGKSIVKVFSEMIRDIAEQYPENVRRIVE